METLLHAADTLGHTATRLLLDPSSRIFWPFIAVGLVFALFIAARERKVALAPHERAFSRASWLSDSAMVDYGLVLLNALLFAFMLGAIKPDINNSVAGLLSIFDWVPPLAQTSPWWTPVALAACLFIVDDFIRYVVHFFEHKVPALWELHKVHHSAEVLNFITSERHHPISLLYFQLSAGVGVAIVNAAFLILLPQQVSPAALLGGNAFWILTNLAGGALRHSPVWVSFGPVVEKWLISPAQHQVHHSTDAKHFDCNLGSNLAVWDRLFGTLYVTTRERERIVYGLGAEDAQFRSLGGAYLYPLKRLAAMIGRKPLPA